MRLYEIETEKFIGMSDDDIRDYFRRTYRVIEGLDFMTEEKYIELDDALRQIQELVYSDSDELYIEATNLRNELALLLNN